MALQLTTNRSLISKKLAGAFIAIFALFIQPLVALDVPSAFAAPVTDKIVINEFYPAGGASGAWVELYNPTSSDVSTLDWGIATPSMGRIKNISGGPLTIPAHSFYTVDFSNSTGFGNGGELILRDGSDAVVDSVSYPAIFTTSSWGRQYDGDSSFTARAIHSVTKNTSNNSALPVLSQPDSVQLPRTQYIDEVNVFTSTISGVANEGAANVRVKTTFTSGNANDITFDYYQAGTPNEGYLPLQRSGNDFYFGPTSGFPLQNASSKFRLIFHKAGTYTATSQIIDTTFNYVIYTTASMTIEVEKPAGTRYVSTAGSNTSNDCRVKANPCATIQHAIDEAVDGDAVRVAAGTYIEAVNVNKSVRLLGSQAGVDPRPSTNPTRQPYDSSETTVDAPASKNAFKIAADNVTINGFQVTQNGGVADAIKASDTHNNLTIRYNMVIDATDEGIQLEAGDTHLVSNNYVLNSTGDGITLSTGSPIRGSDLRILNNDIVGSKSAYGSIYLYGTNDVTIRGNYIVTKATGMAIGSNGLPVSNVVISNNTIETDLHAAYSAYAFGVGIDGDSSSVKLTGNTITQVGTPTAAESAYPDRHALVRVGVAATAQPSGVTMRDNNFSKVNPTNYVYVNPAVTSKVNAARNWWSADTDPAAKITSTTATVTHEPWLCEAYDSNANPMQSNNGVCDFNDPVVTVDQTDRVKKDTAFTVSGTVSDDKDASPTVIVTINNTAYTADVNGGIWTANIPASNGLGDDRYAIGVLATDDYGNDAHVLGSVTIDGTAPVFSKSAVRNADGSYTLSATSSDTDIDDATVQLLLNGTQQLPVTVSTNGDGSRTWTAVTAPLVNGLTYTFMVSATDTTGNSTTSNVQTFVVPKSVVDEPGKGSGFTASNGSISPLPTVASAQAVTQSIGTTSGTSGADEEVLGTSTDDDEKESKDKVATIATSEEGWKLWGVAWYWWLLLLAAVAAGSWYGAKWYRNRTAEF